MSKELSMYLKGVWLGWLFCRMIYQYKTLGWQSFVIYGLMMFMWILMDIKDLKGGKQ